MNKFIKNTFYYFSGIGFLILAKLKNAFVGYTPRTFSDEEIERGALYDMEIVDNWIKELKGYIDVEEADLFKDKRILELGPGSDFGVGLYLLSKSAKKYTAVDVNDNAIKSAEDFYNLFFKILKEKKNISTEEIEGEYRKLRESKESRLNFIQDKDFDIARALNGDKVDYIFSNAAFEHFADVEETIKSVSKIAVKGSVFLAIVDLKTHSRWIREKDPNNIYRYQQGLYKLLSNVSTPNRVRPYIYEKILKENGWENIIVKEGQTITDEQLAGINNYLNKKFRDPVNQMKYLTCTIFATKA